MASETVGMSVRMVSETVGMSVRMASETVGMAVLEWLVRLLVCQCWNG